MAPTINLDFLSKRQYGYGYGYNDGYYYGSSWDRWGRWVALVCIIVFVLILAFVFSCLNARRRRSRGLPPRYGTGWIAGKPPVGHNGPQYNYYNGANGGYNGGAPAPPYSPPMENNNTGNTFNSNDGYYGQQSGIELQQPQHSYQPPRGGEPVYGAPPGPPPAKGGY